MCYIGGAGVTQWKSIRRHQRQLVTRPSGNGSPQLVLSLAIVGAVGLVIAYIQVHEMREEARIQHLTTLVDKWDSPDWIAIRKSLAQRRVDQTQERLKPLDVDDAPIEFYDELNFCED